MKSPSPSACPAACLSPRSRHRWWAPLAACAAALAMAACGGSGDEPAAPTEADDSATVAGAGDYTASGTVTGFGSVIIDGRRLDDAAAAVAVDNGASAPAAGTLADLKLGMSVDARVEGGRLKEVVVRAKLDGPVGSIDLAGGSFTVYGQTVKVLSGGATPTLFEGVANLAGLAAGERVEVHGTVDANRALNATRVERKPQGEAPPAVRIGGVVTQLDANARTFRFNDLTIDYAQATLTPTGDAPANGQLVLAFGSTPPAAGRFVASALRIVKAADGQAFAIGGRVTSANSIADFTVSGVRIDASSATLDGVVAADVIVGASVAAEGRMAEGRLRATKLRIIKTAADARSSLTGQVSDFVSAASFKLRETPVDASTATFVGGSAGELGNGAWIVATGKAQGDAFKAERVEFVRPPVAQPVRLMGEVRDWNAEARTLRLMGMNVRLAQNVELVGGTLANLANGRRIELTGTPGAEGVVLATRVALLSELAPPRASVAGGRIAQASDGRFMLPGGITVTYQGGTAIEGGTAAHLANGVAVLALGSINGTTRTLAAQWIQIVPADSGPRIAGAVSGLVSAGEFKIGEQRIDASSATFEGGTAADLANGSVVIANGTMAERGGARWLVASRVRILLR